MHQSEPNTRRIALEFSTTDAEFVRSLLGANASPGLKLEISPGTVLEYLGSEAPMGAMPGLPEIIHFGVGIGTGVATKFIADWLFQRIKRKDSIVRLRVNRTVIEVTPNGLARKIQEIIDLDLQK
jgi:hypothetical protein